MKFSLLLVVIVASVILMGTAANPASPGTGTGTGGVGTGTGTGTGTGGTTGWTVSYHTDGTWVSDGQYGHATGAYPSPFNACTVGVGGRQPPGPVSTAPALARAQSPRT